MFMFVMAILVAFIIGIGFFIIEAAFLANSDYNVDVPGHPKRKWYHFL